MSSSLEALIPELQYPARALRSIAESAGLLPRVTSTLRTHGQQARLYARFLAGHSAYPAAPPGTSAHEFGYAFDMIVQNISDQYDLGSVWESWGGKWGREHDPIHFEYPGFSIQKVPLPKEGGFLYSLVNFASGFVPGLGEVQLADSLYRLFGDDQTLYEFYLQHPAEFVRDVLPVLLP